MFVFYILFMDYLYFIAWLKSTKFTSGLIYKACLKIEIKRLVVEGSVMSGGLGVFDVIVPV
jgi:hypothetical protein